MTIARNLRNNPTDAERTLWRRLRLRQVNGARFRRQHPVGNFVVDFVCLEEKLVVEVDGGQHAESAADVARTEWLKSRGFRVLRFWNSDVLKHPDEVAEEIMRCLALSSKTPHPSPPTAPAGSVAGERPPQGGRISLSYPNPTPPRKGDPTMFSPSPLEGEGRDGG